MLDFPSVQSVLPIFSQKICFFLRKDAKSVRRHHSISFPQVLYLMLLPCTACANSLCRSLQKEHDTAIKLFKRAIQAGATWIGYVLRKSKGLISVASWNRGTLLAPTECGKASTSLNLSHHFGNSDRETWCFPCRPSGKLCILCCD